MAVVHLGGRAHCLDSSHGLAGVWGDLLDTQDDQEERANIARVAVDLMGWNRAGIVESY